MSDDFRSWGEDLNMGYYSDDDDNILIDHTSYFETKTVFQHREEFVTFVKDTARSLGFTIRIESSILKSLIKKPRLTLDCTRHGAYKADKPSSKDTGTNKCSCQFRLKGRKQDDVWRLEVHNGVHNHHMMTHPEGHAYLGRLTEKENELVKKYDDGWLQTCSNFNTNKKENPNNRSTIKTINNARAKLQKEAHAGRTPIQQLLHLLHTNSYVWTMRSDYETEELQDIFFAHPRSIQYFQAFPYVLFMDCTYKTNRLRLPLLEIVGVTSTGNTFSVAFVFMQSEKIENYIWALRCLRTNLGVSQQPRVILTDRDMALMQAVSNVFPNSNALLCKWHIQCNVKLHCKSTLGDAWKGFKQQWNRIVDSNTLYAYQTNTRAMAETFAGYPIALTYIGELLQNYHTQFVALWTNQTMHYGNRTTNRAEAQHSKLKKYLRISRGKLATVFQYIDEMVVSEESKIKHALEKSRSYVKHAYACSIFKRLRGFVSNDGLQHIKNEMERCNYIATNGMDSCGCALILSHGLPCAHELLQYLTSGVPIPLESIDLFWKKLDISESTSQPSLDCMPDIDNFMNAFKDANPVNQEYMLRKMREAYDPATTPVTKPDVKQSHGRPSAYKKPDTSTRREPSGHVYVDGRASTSGPRWGISRSASQRAPEKKRASFHEKRPAKTPNQTSKEYIEQFPAVMQSYINCINDVDPDGNCGFRAIAKSLELLYGDYSWLTVRQDLLNELLRFPQVYAEMFGGESGYTNYYEALSFFEDGKCGRKYWFSALEMGHLVASRYNITFVVLGKESHTFLPWRTCPPPQPLTICIGHVNGNHFVHVSLPYLSPVPSINLQWNYYKQDQALYWEFLLESQLERYFNF